jgi:predicted Zn-dependent peptidase
VDAISREIDRLATEGLRGSDLAEAKQQLKGQVTLALESPSTRMHRLAGLALHDEPYRTIDETLAEIDQVSPGAVAAVAGEFFPAERQTVVWLGPN